MATILIVDDEAIQRRRMAQVAETLGHRTVEAESAAAARALLTAGGQLPGRAPAIDLVVADAAATGRDGASIARFGALPGAPPVIAAVAPGMADVVAGLMRAGAADFVVKPVSPERLAVSVANALRMQALRLDVLRTQNLVQTLGARAPSPAGIVADDPAMVRALSVAGRAARAPGLPVLIEGEAGSGREMLARLIHAGGEERRTRPFAILRCAIATPASLEHGLFAARACEAQGGTLYLDDVDALPAALQAQVMQIVNAGDDRERARRTASGRAARGDARQDVRVIAATRASLLEAVRRGAFREDLFYRFSVLPITLPPLRTRRGDIGALAHSFLARFAAAEGKAVRDIAPDALALLRGYSWPGNVAELENAMFRAVALAEGDWITTADLPQIAARMAADAARPFTGFRLAPAPAGACADEAFDGKAEARAGDPSAVTLVDGDGDVRPLEAIEADIIRFAIRHYQGRMSEVSRRLGIGRSTLYRKLKNVCFDGEANGSAGADVVVPGDGPGPEVGQEDTEVAV
ncbi:DNA-binding NtrC family response regulator [Pseudochelatococcus lubricantis]|uniref:DNA-binding transcriptional regulator NtrC n=1 Tax=Pseudochelatococcus lubricantis TaxID=1538102 RepID=A0ABX0UZL1_9HYPH|nr:sigma-54 dependent transcriptional regulator [Pseudochelatococcus lubricantis]NIJ58366.1 DNA-binding NtrC family response regulator [Pseudochelatococcus lubricantis]